MVIYIIFKASALSRKEDKMKKITMSSGYTIDIVGSGTNTFGKENHSYQGEINMDVTEVLTAIEAGYRHFDTAISYRNEAVLAKGIRESGYKREDFFITSKIPGKSPYIDSEVNILESVHASLKELHTDYIDLYLIHHPWDSEEEIYKVYRELEKCVDQGLIRSLGVSNFNQEQLKHLFDRARIKPVINQIESNPSNFNHELIEYTQSLGMRVEAWGPLSRVTSDNLDILSEISKKYNKTWAQVLLRFQIERNVIVIPKSHNEKRQKENLDIFDFELSQKDKNTIYNL